MVVTVNLWGVYLFRREGLQIFAKRILLLAVVILTAMFQNTDGLLPEIFGAHFMPLIPLTVCIGMYAGEIAGLVYGAFAGCFWDVCAIGADGFHGFYLALTGCVAGVLVHYIMRNSLLTQYCITAVSSVLFSVIYWLATVYIPIGDSRCEKLLGFYLPSAIITTAFSFVSYYTVKLFFRKKQTATM